MRYPTVKEFILVTSFACTFIKSRAFFVVVVCEYGVSPPFIYHLDYNPFVQSQTNYKYGRQIKYS